MRAPPVSITLPDDNIKTGVQRDRVSYHFGAAQAFCGDCKHPAIRWDEFQFPLYERLFVAIYAAGFAYLHTSAPYFLPRGWLSVNPDSFIVPPSYMSPSAA